MKEPNYADYSLLELYEAHEGIDRDAYPERFKKIEGLIAVRIENGELDALKQESENSEEQVLFEHYNEPPERQVDEDGNYIPNEISREDLTTNIVLSLILLGYGGYSLSIGQIWIPVKKIVITLYGTPLLIMLASIVCAIILMLTLVADHYDKRDNEMTYYKVASSIRALGITLFVLALIWAVFTQ